MYMQSCFGQNARMRKDNKNKEDNFLIVAINWLISFAINGKCNIEMYIYYVISSFNHVLNFTDV